MKSFFAREVLAHPIVLGAWGVVALIGAGSAAYYAQATTPPALMHGALAAQSPSGTVAAQGVVAPAQNPDLFFEVAGRVTAVSVAVGQSVRTGQLLASLDTASLSAARDQAAANLAGAQAKLDALRAGPRSVDVSAKETAVSQATQTLANLYAQVPLDLSSAYSSSLGAVHADTDSLFNTPNDDNAVTLAFTTTDSQLATDAAASRAQVNAALGAWQADIAAPGATHDALDLELATALARLKALRAYADLLTQAVGEAVLTGSFTASSVTAANTNLAAFRTSINASIAALQADTQAIASDKLSIQSAQDALAQTTAPATAQDLEAAQAAVSAAQASLSSAQAALSNAVIVAPFYGTVSAVRVKVGDLASAATPAISLTPQSALEVEGYLSEADAASVAAGDSADITLDAFGSARHFPATVASVDRAPTEQAGVPAYKVVLQFAQNDPTFAPGMTANITITTR